MMVSDSSVLCLPVLQSTDIEEDREKKESTNNETDSSIAIKTNLTAQLLVVCLIYRLISVQFVFALWIRIFVFIGGDLSPRLNDTISRKGSTRIMFWSFWHYRMPPFVQQFPMLISLSILTKKYLSNKDNECDICIFWQWNDGRRKTRIFGKLIKICGKKKQDTQRRKQYKLMKPFWQ